MKLDRMYAIMGFSVALTCIVFACLLLFTSAVPLLVEWRRYVLTGVLLAYSAYRIYRSFALIKPNNEP
jgi:hypothetical protein